MARWSKKQLDDVFKKSSGTCRECGRQHKRTDHGKTWQVDHIFPYSKDGPDDLNNLAVACNRCNNSKGAGASIADVMDSITGRR